MAAYHDVRLHGVVGGVRRGARHHGCTVQRGCWHKWIVGTVLGNRIYRAAAHEMNNVLLCRGDQIPFCEVYLIYTLLLIG